MTNKQNQLAELMRLSDECVAAASRESIAGCKGGFDSARAALESHARKMVEGEPVAWGAQNTRSGKWGYIWHEEDDVQGWINLQHQSQDSATYRGPVPLYDAPRPQPSPAVQPDHRAVMQMALDALEEHTTSEESGRCTCCGHRHECAKACELEKSRATLRQHLSAPARLPLGCDQIHSLWETRVGWPTLKKPLMKDDVIAFARAIEAAHGIHPAA